jgi:hypothetical protein
VAALCPFCRTPPDDATWQYQNLLKQSKRIAHFLALLEGMGLGVQMLSRY